MWIGSTLLRNKYKRAETYKMSLADHLSLFFFLPRKLPIVLPGVFTGWRGVKRDLMSTLARSGNNSCWQADSWSRSLSSQMEESRQLTGGR